MFLKFKNRVRFVNQPIFASSFRHLPQILQTEVKACLLTLEFNDPEANANLDFKKVKE
jgi:hypothetical protein